MALAGTGLPPPTTHRFNTRGKKPISLKVLKGAVKKNTLGLLKRNTVQVFFVSCMSVMV
jgi:hypothetical protein